MARDSRIPVRKAIIKALKASPAVTALVPSTRIYPAETPATLTWPFIRYGTPSVLPLRASCLDGNRLIVAVHGFSKLGEEAADNVAAAMARALDGAVLDLSASYPAKGHVTWVGGQTLRDTDEADAWHAVVNLEITVTS